MAAPFSHYTKSNLKHMFSKDQIIFESSSINEIPSDKGHLTFEEDEQPYQMYTAQKATTDLNIDTQSDKQDNIMTENLQTLDGPSP